VPPSGAANPISSVQPGAPTTLPPVAVPPRSSVSDKNAPAKQAGATTATANGSNGASGTPPSDTTSTGVKYLLPPLLPEEKGKKTLVLDLDETLVHSSFKPIPDPDFVISIELDGVVHRVYVRKRPGVDNFLRAVGEKYEVVVFTASLAKYADPLLDILDRSKTVKVRLFREACVQHYGNYVKDLTHLGRQLEQTIIIDNSPFSYMFQPDNAIPISSWFSDKNDRQLYDLLPFLESLLPVEDVSTILTRHRLTFNPPT
jgi:RNA polymerase II subunit A small phosphatase-like protein